MDNLKKQLIATNRGKGIRILSLLLSIFLLTSIPSVGVTALSSDTVVSVSPDQQTVLQGSTFTITINVTPAEPIAGIQMDVTYNASLLQVQSVSYGDIFGTNSSTYYFNHSSIDNTAGVITGIVAALTPTGDGVADPGIFAHIEFTATTDSVGMTDLLLSNVVIGNPDATEISTSLSSGSVIVQADITTVSAVPSTTTVTQNEVFTVDIDVDPRTGIAGIGIDLEFNPTLVHAINVTYDDFFAAYSTYSTQADIDNTQGKITECSTVITTPGGNVTTPGTFATITFKAQKLSGTTPINITARVWNMSAQQIPINVGDAMITVNAVPTQLSVITSSAHVPAGSTLTVNITADPAEPIAGIQFNVAFNSSLLTAVSVTQGDFFEGHDSYFIPGSIDNDTGVITNIAGALTPSGPGITTSGTVAVIEFVAATVEGTATINLTDALLGDPAGLAVPVITQNASVTITLEITFQFHPGWNLITLPIQQTYTAETLAQEIPHCDAITRWNTTALDFETHPVSTPVLDFSIIPGIGYFVHVTAASNFTLTGTPIATVSVPLAAGWNLIGWPLWEPATAETLGQEITGCDTMLGWNADFQKYIGHPVGTPVNNFAVNTGDGLFIHVTEPSTWEQP